MTNELTVMYLEQPPNPSDNYEFHASASPGGARSLRRFWSRAFAAVGLAVKEGEQDEESHIGNETDEHRHRLAAGAVRQRNA